MTFPPKKAGKPGEKKFNPFAAKGKAPVFQKGKKPVFAAKGGMPKKGMKGC